ncbi:hypothetical protein FB45DRAFT_825303 [Roridomyces roridus]|uniref:F-box domain-containing protein n=1 Tax=Roridomyces roridus TaxID=1738132 RepID=A0AAD7FST5_9AGAR|nr:hypothetical protein FB45DRAFT_825303 [Roridomyces roridus]
MDIFSEILVHTLPPYPLCSPLTGRASPIPLTHVCRRWREIALATPQLWRSIALPFACTLDYHIRVKQTEAVRTWLDRSGSCPLSVQIHMEEENNYLSIWAGGWREIPLYRESWEQLEIKATEYALRSLLACRMPMLRSLSLTMEDDSLSHPRVDPRDFPRLQAVSLTLFQSPVDWLPWGQMTSLTIEDMSSGSYIPILRDAIHLVDLTLLDCEFFMHSNPESPAGIPLTQLTSLVIMGSNVVQILGAIDTPVLQALQISGEDLGDESEDPIGTLAALISRSRCGMLRKLLIAGPRSPWVSKKAFRSAFPAIPEIAFNSRFRLDARQEGDQEDSGDNE